MRAAGKERSAPQTEGARYAAAIFSIALVYEGRQAPVSERKRWRRRKRFDGDAGADGRSRTKAWCGSRRQEPDKGLARQCVCIYTEFLRSDIQKAAAPGCFPPFQYAIPGRLYICRFIFLPYIKSAGILYIHGTFFCIWKIGRFCELFGGRIRLFSAEIGYGAGIIFYM